MSVVLEPGGVVKVDGLPIPGGWHHVQLGAVCFEAPGVLSTDVMSNDALRVKLAEMYSAQSK